MRQRIGVQPRDRRGIGRILCDGFHVRGDCAGFDGGHLTEVGSGDFAQLERESILLEPRKPVGEVIDRVVGNRQRAVPARIGHFELVIGVQFFGRVDGHHRGPSRARVNSAAVGVERELRVNQIAMIAQQPFDTVRATGFFVGRERQNDVPVGMKILFAQTNERRDHDGVGRFHVLRAAAVEISVAFEKMKRIDRPFVAPRFDHIEMADQKDWAARAGAAQSRHQVSFARIRAQHLRIARGKPGVAQALRP